MEDDFKTDLENLKEKSQNIAKVLRNSTETFERYFDDSLKDEYSSLNVNTFPDLRLDSLDRLLGHFRSSLKLTSPCVEEASETIAKLNTLNSKISSIKEKMKNVSVSSDFLQLCDLEKRINDNHLKLECVEKIQKHLNPGLFNYVDLDTEDEDYEEFYKIIRSAEELKSSRKLCHSLKQFDQLSESPFVSEALKRVDGNFELVSQMCYMWLTKHIKKISVLSSRVDSDSGIINDPLINVSDRDDKIGIITIFETSTVDKDRPLDDHFSTPFGSSGKERDPGVDRNLSLRILKILIMSPIYLLRFLDDTNNFLSELSLRRFTSLLQYINLDSKSKNNAIYDVFMNLQLVLSLIKSSVLSLYHNCELDFYRTPNTDLGFLNAPNYIDKITLNLVPPLENKLERILDNRPMTSLSFEQGSILSSSSINSDVFESVITVPGGETETPDIEEIYVSDILDLYTASQICHFYYNKVLNILKPPYLHFHPVSGDLFRSESYVTDYKVEESPMLTSFTGMCNKWNEQILSKLQQNITMPLFNNQISRKLDPNQVVERISNFLSETVSIQLEYSGSDDLVTILEMTINPVINWCQKVSDNMGDKSQFFLLLSFSTLLNSIQSTVVDRSFKLMLEDLININVDTVVIKLEEQVITTLGGNIEDASSFQVQFTSNEFLEKIWAIIFTDTLTDYLPEDLSTSLKGLDSTNFKLICKLVYMFMASVYKRYSEDTERAQELLTLASAYC